MVEIADVEDEESLVAWLKAWAERQPEDAARRGAVTLAFRSALRVLPAYLTWSGEDIAPRNGLTNLLGLRLTLVSGVAAIVQTREIEVAAISARTAAGPAPAALMLVAGYAPRAASDAHATYASRAVATGVLVAGPPYAERDWSEARADLTDLQNGEDLTAVGIWRLGEDSFATDWTEVQETLAADPDSAWRFWLDWYTNAREGRHLPLDLWEAIALIDDDIWEAGPEAVAEEIARLQKGSRSTASEIDAEIDRMSGASSTVVQTVRKAMSANARELPPTFDAIEQRLLLEIERLQTKNYASELVSEDVV